MSSLQLVFSHPQNSFCASHFLLGFGKCERLHGHNYIVEVRLEYKKNVPAVNFSEINLLIRSKVKVLDQKILLAGSNFEVLIESALNISNWIVTTGEKRYSFPKKDVIILEGFSAITSENLAKYLHLEISKAINEMYPNTFKWLKIIIEENYGNKVLFSDKIFQK
ncbi:6-pyruvoyl trahydropterin synthase family protein [Candidatus Hodarchaeum mangrovi]